VNSKNIETAYPLSPMQQGMLFHTLYAPESGTYFQQLSCTLKGELNVGAFQQAWQQVVDRHPIWRTAFVWDNIEKPLQVVVRQAKVPCSQQDWRGLSSVEQQEQLQAFLRADRKQGFQLSKAPLMRIALIQMDEETYQFIWSHHHLLLDGWSLSLVFKEVFAFYEAFRRGQNLQLKPCRPYQDYIAWLQQQDLTKTEAFWRQVLQGFTAPTPLEVDKASEGLSKQGESYAEQQIELSAATTGALQSLARQHQLTLNTLVQGAWTLLLSRYSGQEDVVFGVTVSGRPATLAGVESMVGLFINTLPVRVQVSPRAYLLPWLKQLQAQQVELRQYEYSSLIQVQGWSEVPRGLPLFESIVVFENYPLDASLRESGSSLELCNIQSVELTNYPLTVVAWPGRELLLQIGYDCHRFDAATITRMLGHLQTLLEGIVAHPEQQLEGLPLLTQEERQQLLVEWNETQADYQQDKCIHQLFEAQVEQTPEVVAVMFEGQQLTYRELNCRANQVANYLCSLGIGPDTLVGICVERSLEMVVGLLGILKAGGAYVPLDPAYPQERVALMLADAQVPVLLTQERLLDRLPENNAQVVCLDRDWADIQILPNQNLQTASYHPAQLAYVIYTSGSTGKPKGVAIEQRSLVNYAQTAIAEYGLQECDRILQFSSISFDAAIEEIFPTLIFGATLVLRTDVMLTSVPAFLQSCAAWQITILDLPTAFWHQLTAELSHPDTVLPPFLRLVIIGGEKALPAQLQVWQQNVGQNVRLFNSYGPTETTVVATVCDLTSQPELTEIPIGRPIKNTQTYILDRYMQPVPIGVTGELYIGGAGVARGYLNHPELTAEKFIPNPFSNAPGGRLFKTGDQARYLSDGNIEYLGRLDNQVKMRGFRIELEEIELALLPHPAVREVVVLAREDVSGDRRLVAYVVPQPEQKPSTSDLRYFLQERLPNYMLPSIFMLLEALPLLPNGKLDRRSLPAPDNLQPELAATYVAPQTELERTIATIWQEVLQITKVGLYDNFFDLGGHSLLMIQVHSKLRQILNRDLSMIEMFKYPTVNSFAKYLSQEKIDALSSLQKSNDQLEDIKEGRNRLKQRLARSSAVNQKR
jgi:surfactin family lipopeptide synthetase C